MRRVVFYKYDRQACMEVESDPDTSIRDFDPLSRDIGLGVWMWDGESVRRLSADELRAFSVGESVLEQADATCAALAAWQRLAQSSLYADPSTQRSEAEAAREELRALGIDPSALMQEPQTSA